MRNFRVAIGNRKRYCPSRKRLINSDAARAGDENRLGHDLSDALALLGIQRQWRSRSAFSTVEAAKNQQSPTMNNGFQNYRRTLYRRVPIILRQQIEQPDHAPGQRTHQNDGTEAQREHQRCLGRDPVSVEQ